MRRTTIRVFSQKKYLCFKVRRIKIRDVVRGVAQPGRVLAWGARGRKFESCHPDHNDKKKRSCADFSMYISDSFFTKKRGGCPPFFRFESVGPGLWIGKLTGVGREIFEMFNKIIDV